MNHEGSITTYLIAQPFHKALKAVREALSGNGISICWELDVTSRVEQDLQIGFIPCTTLLVESRRLLVEAATLDDSAAVLFPMHVGVTGRGLHTLVHWIDPLVFAHAGLPAAATDAFATLESAVARSLDRIAIRRDIYEPALADAE